MITVSNLVKFLKFLNNHGVCNGVSSLVAAVRVIKHSCSKNVSLSSTEAIQKQSSKGVL